MMKHATLTIAMEDCQASRPGTITRDTSLLRLLFSGAPPEEKLVKRGTVQVEGQQYTLYLPQAQSYLIQNTKPGTVPSRTPARVFLSLKPAMAS